MYYNVIEYQKLLKSTCRNNPFLTFYSIQVVYLKAHVKNRFKKTPGPRLEVGSEYIRNTFLINLIWHISILWQN